MRTRAFLVPNGSRAEALKDGPKFRAPRMAFFGIYVLHVFKILRAVCCVFYTSTHSLYPAASSRTLLRVACLSWRHLLSSLHWDLAVLSPSSPLAQLCVPGFFFAAV